MSGTMIFTLAKQSFKSWGQDKASRLGAAVAYYAIFSIGPLLLIAISVAGLVFGQKAAQGQIVSTIGSIVGQEASVVIQNTIQNASKGSNDILFTIIGLVTLLLGAAGLFGNLQGALNTIFEVQPKPNAGLKEMIRSRLMSFLMVLVTGLLLMASLIINSILLVIGTYVKGLLPGGDLLWQAVTFAVSLAVLAFLFAVIFKMLPDATIAWKDALLGALVTAILFVIGQIGLTLYLGSGSVGSPFGGAGALVIILVWIYYSAQILFLGAEFTKVYANQYGSKIKPMPFAEFVDEQTRAQQGIPYDRETKRKTSEAGERSRLERLRMSPWFRW